MVGMSRSIIAGVMLFLTLAGVRNAEPAGFSKPLGCAAGAGDFRVTAFATGLNFPYGLDRLADGSLVVATSRPTLPGGGYFATTGELLRFVDADDDGIADGPGTVVYTGLPGALTAVRRAGSLLFVSSALSGITVLRIGAPYVRIGEITLRFPLSGTEPWYHKSYALEVRPTPGGGTDTVDVFFNVGSQFNAAPTSGVVQVGGLVHPAIVVNGDAIHKITVTDGPGGPTFSAPVQIASGLRNAAGIAIHPARGDLYFADNGIDGLADDTEPLSVDEINVIPFSQIGMGEAPFFGFPDSYTEYRTGRVVGGAGVQPLVTFQPLAGATFPESEGPALIAIAPAGFPSPLNDGLFVGFHGQPSYGIANEENPLVFYSFLHGTYCHFVSNEEPDVGHLNGVLSTDDSLFVADMATNGALGSSGTAKGVIYQIMSTATFVAITATDAVATEAGPTTGTLTVTRSGSTAVPLTVFYTVSGAARADIDYVGLSGSVTIPSGSASAVMTVTPVDDTVVERDETVTVTLSGGPGYSVGPSSTATVTMVSNDVPTLTIVATDATATEAGRTAATFTVRRTGTTTAALPVFYVVRGTANAGADYMALPGSLTIPAGARTATIAIKPINDALMERNETVQVTLAANTSYTVGAPSTATITIISDEVVTVAATDATAAEGGPDTGRFTVRRTGSTAGALIVYYMVTGTATAGSDYRLLPVSVTIPAGARSVSITVTPIDDGGVEGIETVVLTLAPRATYTLGSARSATVTITSDD
jgi:glucose/arabinose dehydrogenase